MCRQTVKTWESDVQSVVDVVFLSHIKGKRRSTVLLFGNRTFLVCSLAVVIHGPGLRTHPPLAWNWVLQDEIERARVSFLAAMCQLLGEGSGSVGKYPAAVLRERAGPCWFAGRAWWVGFAKPWGTTCTRRQCTVRISRYSGPTVQRGAAAQPAAVDAHR